MADEKNWDANRKVDAPEARNLVQNDEESQAQTLAEEALAARRGQSSDGSRHGGDGTDSIKAKSGESDDDVQDIVDHMKQMERSGRLDFDAFRGERNDDDEEDGLGPDGVENDRPRGAD